MPPGLLVLGVKFLQGFVLAEISAKFFPSSFSLPHFAGHRSLQSMPVKLKYPKAFSACALACFMLECAVGKSHHRFLGDTGASQPLEYKIGGVFTSDFPMGLIHSSQYNLIFSLSCVD